MSLQTKERTWNFIDDGPQIVSAYNSAGHSTFVKRITGSATIALTTGGIALAMDATSEVQVAALYFNDLLQYDIDDVLQFEFMMSVSTAIGAASRWSCGMGSAYNAAAASVTASAWFVQNGSTTVRCETDDNVNDNNLITTGETLATTKKRFLIDFQNGLGYHVPPATGVGGKGNVKFYMGKGRDLALAKVATGTRFNMENYSSGLQPYFQIEKTSGTNVGTILIEWAKVRYRVRT